MSTQAPSLLSAFAHSSFLVATTLASVGLLSGSLPAQPFVPDGSMPIGGSVYAQGDLNEDGLDDVVVGGGSFVATLMGNGAGFDSPTIQSMPDFSRNDLELVDMDGNGALDVVLVGYTQDSTTGSRQGWVVVFLNSGGGVLASPTYFPLKGIPEFMAAADLDSDGRVDLAIVHEFWWVEMPDPVLVLLNDGNGGFLSAPVKIDLGWWNWPTHVTAGDVDGDGAVDLIVSSWESLFLLLNDGLGGFDVSSFGWRSEQASIADVNGDGHQDVIVTYGYDCSPPGIPVSIWCSALEIYLGDGSGGFDGGLIFVDSPNTAPGTILSADIDEDGDVDILGVNLWSSNLGTIAILLENQGDATFHEHSIGLALPPTGGMIDYDGDGSLDVVGLENYWDPITGNYVSQLAWFRNNFETRFETFEHHMTVQDPTSWWFSIRLQVAEDMDGDGDSDVVVATRLSPNDGELRVYANDGKGTLSLLSTAPLTSSLLLSHVVHAADIDGDGDMDVVVRFYGDVRVFLNDGGGHLALALVLSAPTEYVGRAFSIGDLDGDDLLEIIAAYSFSDGGGFYVFRQTSPGVFELAQTHDSLGSVEDVQLGDTDGDGLVDVVFRHTTSADVHGFGVLAGDGLGGLVDTAQLHAFAPGDMVEDVVVADLDDDGLSDVVLTCSLEDIPQVGVYLAQAGSVLPPLAQQIVTKSNVRIEAITDLDGDGAPDLVGILDPGGSVEAVVWINDGAGQLTATDSFTSFYMDEIVAGDVDGDGAHDLVSASEYDELVTVRLNDGTGQFSDPSWFWMNEPGWGWKRQLLLAPMDANGTVDLLRDAEIDGVGRLSVYLSVHDATPPGSCELDFNGDGAVTQADHAQIVPEVDGIYYATWTYLYRPDWFALYFPDVNPATLDWNGDGEITLVEVAPGVPFSMESYYWQWLVYLLRDWIIENYGVDYYAEWWPDSGCE